MTFYSVAFLIFFLVFSVIMNSVKSLKTQHAVFLLANCVFYAYWDYRFLFMLLFVVLVCYLSAIMYEKRKRKPFIHGAVVFCVALLGVFKYFNFFSESFSKAFGLSDHITLNLVLPLGISFYLFQSMSYLLDVMYGKVAVERDFVKLAAYITFFPQITAGPIVKSKFFLPQLDKLHRIRKENVYAGIQLFLTGLTKKVVIADRIGVAVDAVYSAPAAYNGISVAFAIVGYAIQLYCDFSGYSNMAIGIARMWDFYLGDNFNAPFLATNPSDLWRRWHISLSTWFRDYIYIPLGGSRKGKIRTYFNLFVTMLISGLWHGANYTFILWGAIHGVACALHKGFNDLFKREKSSSLTIRWLCVVLGFAFFVLSFVVFRAASVGEAMEVYRALFNTTGIMYINVYSVVYLILFICINVYSAVKNSWNIIEINLNLDKFSNRILLGVWLWGIVMLMYCGNSAFIYAQF